MRGSRTFFFFASLTLVLVATACGGSADEPTDPSDPAFLPTGTYALHVVDASCDVNRAFQSEARAALFRNGPGRAHTVNIPLPTRFPRAVDSTPRQDVDLARRHVDLELATDERCGGVKASVDVTELSAERLVVAYAETPTGCDVPACSVTYAFDLVERACPRDCKATSADLFVSGDAMTWRCACE